MKILHTADWHIGKMLYKYPLQDELALFFDWLIELIEKENVDVLLISGDVFDYANPAAKDRKLYYQFLSRLTALDTRIIITGGNHDSIGVLNAPRDILEALNVTVIGGATKNIAEELIEIKDKNGTLQMVVAAVPFLRDRALRNKTSDETYENRTDAIRAGIKNHYAELAEICEEKYASVPVIAMGHLYAVGVDRSESERDIHVGNTAAVDNSFFPPVFQYVALGHIHRPQIIGKNECIRYSGSPIALSFSEKKDEKSVVLVEYDNNEIAKPKVIPVPKWRELKRITGKLETVKSKLEKYEPDYPLHSFVEIEVLEEEFSSVILGDVEALKMEYTNHDKFKILKGKTTFQSGAKDTSDLFQEGQHIEDLTPREVFVKRLEGEDLDADKEKMLVDAFQELLEMVEQSGEL